MLVCFLIARIRLGKEKFYKEVLLGNRIYIIDFDPVTIRVLKV